MKKQNGFTLVELAIVLMIIGLLIAGILRGQELMENARINSTIQQVKAYEGAKHTFFDEYSSLPGDMALATSRIAGCNPGNFCTNGNGDGRIGGMVTGGGDIGSFNTNLKAGLTAENIQFWKQLALTHLISGVNPSSNPATEDWGKTEPMAKIGGGFIVFYSNSAADFGIGHNLRLQSAPDPAKSCGTGLMPISPIKAHQLDQKMDDGRPDRGNVTADFEGSTCDNGGVYQNTESKNCVMQFLID